MDADWFLNLSVRWVLGRCLRVRGKPEKKRDACTKLKKTLGEDNHEVREQSVNNCDCYIYMLFHSPCHWASHYAAVVLCLLAFHFNIDMDFQGHLLTLERVVYQVCPNVFDMESQ